MWIFPVRLQETMQWSERGISVVTCGRVTAEAAVSNQPETTTVAPEEEIDSQGASASSDGSSSHGGKLAQVEEELSLISASLLSPRYKELVLASIHLAPLRFHEGVSYCPSKKLLERTLTDNIWVSCLYFSFVVCSFSFIFIICPSTSRAYIIH